jgi:FtsH-binding integral membrane protein
MENFENGGAFSQQQIIEETSSFFRKVYGWMFLGLIVSGVTAYYISVKPEYYNY